MPDKERRQAGFDVVEEIRHHEREKTREQQEDDDKDKRDRRCKVTADLAFGNGNDRLEIHFAIQGSRSVRVTARKTSSSRPPSRRSSRSGQSWSCASWLSANPKSSAPLSRFG